MRLPANPSPTFFCGSISAAELFATAGPGIDGKFASIEKYQSFAEEEIVYQSGTTASKVYIHHSGRAILTHKNLGARGLYGWLVAPAMIYGVPEAISGGQYNCDLKMVSSGDFYSIDREDLLKFLRDQPAICFRLAQILSGLCRQATQVIRS